MSSGRGLIVVENEEVNAEESRQVYVPCIWKAVSIYSSHKTKPEGSKVLSTLQWVTLGSWISLLALSVNVMRNFPEAQIVMGTVRVDSIHSGVHQVKSPCRIETKSHTITQLLEFAHACSGPVRSYVRLESAHYSGSSPLRIGPVFIT